MKPFHINKKSVFTTCLICFFSISLMLVLTMILTRCTGKNFSGQPSPSTTVDEMGNSSYISFPPETKEETNGTVASKPSETEASEVTSASTEITQPETTEQTIPTETVHTHSYSSTDTKKATCTEKGLKTYTCACGDSYTKDTTARGHKYQETVVKPTNTAQGYTQHTCTRCEHSYKDNYTDPLIDPNHVHSYVANVVAPNCYKQGYTTYTCSCGRTYKDMNSLTPALGHPWGEWEDMGDGVYSRKCSVCDSREAKAVAGSSLEAGTGGSYMDPSGDPNNKGATYVGPANPETGISWDGKSPIIYTYTDGTTGTQPKLGATYYVKPYFVSTVTIYTMGYATTENILGGPSDGYCDKCGHKTASDGSNGQCFSPLTNGQSCPSCGKAVEKYTCHTCDEE